MKRSKKWLGRIWMVPLSVTIITFCMASQAWSGYKFQINESTKGEINFWTQAWYQYVEDANDSNGDGILGRGNDSFHIVHYSLIFD
jgi:hypothetical protein